MVFVFTFLTLVVIIAIAFFYVSSIISKPPKGRAIEFLQSPPSKKNRIIACIGDSLTHGNIGDCWVESLRDEYPEDTFLNEGINGDVVWQVQQRIEPILACKPDIVILMIGSNDAMASFNKHSGERYKHNNNLPEVPTFESYQRLLPELLDSLSDIPNIALCTIPPVGENPDSDINQHVKMFNDFIELTASNKNISLIPVSSFLWDDLSSRTYQLRKDYDPKVFPIIKRIYGGMFHHYIFKKTWNDVAKSKGQWILFDQIHLNERGAQLVLNLVKKYISSV
jgi:lysophospholipase L1-like esterase